MVERDVYTKLRCIHKAYRSHSRDTGHAYTAVSLAAFIAFIRGYKYSDPCTPTSRMLACWQVRM